MKAGVSVSKVKIFYILCTGDSWQSEDILNSMYSMVAGMSASKVKIYHIL